MKLLNVKVWVSNRIWLRCSIPLEEYHGLVISGHILRGVADDNTRPTQDEINLAFQYAANSGEIV